jgi:hypothetical protein
MAGYKAMDDMTYFEECFAKGQAYQVGEVAGIWTTPVTFHVAFRAIPTSSQEPSWPIRSLDKVQKAEGESRQLNGRANALWGRRNVRPGGDRRGPAITGEGWGWMSRVLSRRTALAGPPWRLPGLVLVPRQANIDGKSSGATGLASSLFLGMPVPRCGTAGRRTTSREERREARHARTRHHL